MDRCKTKYLGLGPLFVAGFVALGATKALAGPPVAQSGPAKLVMVVSVDGLRSDAVPVAARCIERMRQNGASASHASTIRNSTTLPSHASMLSGVDVDQHGMDFNAFKPERGIIRSPTIFRIVRQSGIHTSMIVSKIKFQHLVEPEGTEEFKIPGGSCTQIVTAAAEKVRSGFEGLLFVHIAEVDVAGHKYRWMSPQYLGAVRTADRCVCDLMQVFDGRKDFENDLAIITADHGGHDKMHGTLLEEDRHIPWVVWGGMGQKKLDIKRDISTLDTAATVLYALGVPVPSSMAGKPVKEALRESPAPVCMSE